MKTYIITGVTGSGKTAYTQTLYQSLQSTSLNGIIINCDSRQIYSECPTTMNYDKGTTASYNHLIQAYYISDIPYFGISFVPLRKSFSVFEYLAYVEQVLHRVGTLDFCIISGGTGLWIHALLTQYPFTALRPEYQTIYNEYKTYLSTLTITELKKIALEHNPSLLSTLNESDIHNPRRIQNKILQFISREWHDNTPLFTHSLQNKEVYICPDNHVDTPYIATRLQTRISQGLLEELEYIIRSLPEERIYQLGMFPALYYHYVNSNTMTYDQFLTACVQEEIRYIKRQKTWIKKYIIPIQNEVANI